MELRKTAISVGLAAALLATTLGGFPLSDKGIAAKFGAGTAYAADAAFPSDAFLARLQKVHDALLLGDPADVQDVRNLRSEIDGLTFAANGSLIDPVWNKIVDKLNFVNTEDEAHFKESLFKFLKAVGTIMYDPNLEDLEAIRSNPEYRSAIQLLAEIGGQPNLTIDQILTFLLGNGTKPGLEGTFRNHLAAKSDSQLVVIVASETERNAFIGNVINSVVTDTSYDVSAILGNLGVTGGDINASIANFRAALTKEGPAFNALLVAYIRSEAQEKVVVSSDGRTHTYTLNVLGRDVPASAPITWSKKNGDTSVNVTVNGIVTLPSGTTGTAVIEAMFLNKVIFSKQVTLTAVSTGGGGGGVIIVTPPTVDGILEQFNKDFADIQSKLASADDATKAALIKQAEALALAALEKVNTYDLSKSVKVEGGKAIFEPDVDDIIKKINAFEATLAALVAKLTSIGGNISVLDSAYFTFDLGNIAVDSTELPLSKNVLDALDSASISKIKVKVYGLNIITPVKEFTEDLDLTVNKLPAPSGLNPLTPVFEFGVKTGGVQKNTFSDPIHIQFPIPSTANPDLVTVVRLEGNSYTPVGGDVNGGYIEESFPHFSPYTVIENKATFRDLESVRAWAGKAIEAAASKGITEGMAPGIFGPNERITRAEFAKMVVRAFNLELNDAVEQFEDVKGNEWFAPYVQVAYQTGIINGRAPGKFEPNARITRAEMATMITRALKVAKGAVDVKDVASELAKFTDSTGVHLSLRSGVAFAANHELIVGNKGKFLPTADATRAEAAVIIYRSLGFTTEEQM
ncbi:S-layer homology domain-containing protein [Paenibacillus solisilvae]|uniref:S-layer homology domain-containing protein n=1 Tax=Paenibacillus solisilvae TaxID=2486751 RepID=A0ABW0VWM8_9BACL